MKIRAAIAGSVLAAGIGAASLAGAGSAFADSGAGLAGQPGQPGAPGGVSVSSTQANGNNSGVSGNRLFNGNRFANGNLSGNGLSLSVSFLSGNNVSVFDGAILNSGADSFNTARTRIVGSFNTRTDTSTVNVDSFNVEQPGLYGQPGQPGKPGH